MTFHTDYKYTDRETKARYVWFKYQPILTGRILDVGADECYLKQYLGEDAQYWGIGLGGHPDQVADLEKEKIPFPDNSFDCVLCLDVLEHIENIHEIFDDLCRVTRRYLIISLPSPWSSLFEALLFGDYAPDQPMKFYGLPPEPPEDRHKWFFSNREAQRFICYRADKNKMRVIQIDNYNPMRIWRRLLYTLVRVALPRINLNLADLYGGQLWAVLEKRGMVHRSQETPLHFFRNMNRPNGVLAPKCAFLTAETVFWGIFKSLTPHLTATPAPKVSSRFRPFLARNEPCRKKRMTFNDLRHKPNESS